MKLKSITNKDLLHKIKVLVRDERELTLNVLRHLREVERRRLFAEIGYSSLFEYCVKDLKYSEGAAQRRIASMRLLAELPELADKVEAGNFSLSALAQAQSFFKHEKIEEDATKREILSQLENKSRREIERELVARSTGPAKFGPDKLRAVSKTHTELKMIIENELLEEIQELKNLLAHSHPNASIKEVIAVSVHRLLLGLRVRAPKQILPPPAAVVNSDTCAPKSAKKSRYIPQEIRRVVWKRDAGQCTYTHEGRRCSAKYGIELDHIQPHSMGGKNTEQNLRLRCRAHNELAAVNVFGAQKMNEFKSKGR